MRQGSARLTGLRSRDLGGHFVSDLGSGFVVDGSVDDQPLCGRLCWPVSLRVAAYLWLATAPFERQIGAHKIQVTVPGVRRGERVHIPRELGQFVLFAGFAAEFETWILWDAELLLGPDGISWSRNLQVPVGTLSQAARDGVAVTSRMVRETPIGPTMTTTVACRRSHLAEGIGERFRLGIARQLGGAS